MASRKWVSAAAKSPRCAAITPAKFWSAGSFRIRAEPGLDGSPGAVDVSPLERRLDLLDRHGGILARSRPGALRQAQDTHEPQDPRERAGEGHRLTSRAG